MRACAHPCTNEVLLLYTADSGDEVEVDVDDADSSAADALIDGMVPTPARKKAAREDALSKALNLGEYPEYRGLHGVVDELDPVTACLQFLKLLGHLF